MNEGGGNDGKGVNDGSSTTEKRLGKSYSRVVKRFIERSELHVGIVERCIP